MAEPKYFKVTVQQRREQLYWFINRFLLFSKNPISEICNEYNEVVLFPVDTLGKEAGELFPPYGYGQQGDTDNQIYAYNCIDMLENIKNNLYKIEKKVAPLMTKSFTWFVQDDNLDRDRSYDYNNHYNIVINHDLVPFFEAYLRLLEDNKPAVQNKDPQSSIEKIEVLEDKTENKRTVIYVNGNYHNPMSFSKKKNWGKIYELAKEQETDFVKSFFDYFNSSRINPLYKKSRGFKITKILKMQDGIIVPNIEIKLTTQNKVTRQLKSA